MKRIQFLKNAGLAAAGAFVLPSVLTSNQVLAGAAKRKVKHVVLCVIAGGVRKREAIDQLEGALMPRLFGSGKLPAKHLLDTFDNPYPNHVSAPLIKQGVLFSEFRYAQGPTAQTAALHALLSGFYAEDAESTSQKQVSDFDVTLKLDLNVMDKSQTCILDRITQTKPELTILTLHGADIAHANFTAYCGALISMDHVVGELWQQIQNTPDMANETVLIVLPEHGRNAFHNTVIDEFGRYGLDHATLPPSLGGDQHARESFCLVLGPQHLLKQGAVISTSTLETVHVRPFIDGLLGRTIVATPLDLALNQEV